MQRVAMALVLGLSACGGKVVFVEEDGAGDGGNGNGGSSSSIPSQGGSTVTTTPSPTTATGTSPTGGSGGGVVSCETFDCSVGQTFCSCMGECSVCFGDICSGGTAEQTCQVSGNGMACDCFLAGSFVASCSQASADCGLETGCCLATFQGALQ